MQTRHFGSVGLGLSTALLLLAGAAVWVAQHPQWRGVPRRPADFPVLDRLRLWCSAHFGAVMSGLGDRLGRSGVAAAAFLAGLIAVLVSAVGFTALLDDMLEGDGLARIDEPAAEWLTTHREGWLNTGLTLLTHLGDAAAQTI